MDGAVTAALLLCTDAGAKSESIARQQTPGPRLYEGGRVVNALAAASLGAAGVLGVSSGAHVSIAPSGRGDLSEWERLVRRCMSK
jgi:hypothetical protein